MKNLKSDFLEKQQLSTLEQSRVLGGASCGCACRYANSGGSSTADNKSANAASGLHSPGMIHHTWKTLDDGSQIACDEWVIIE